MAHSCPRSQACALTLARTSSLQGANDVLQVSDALGQPIDARDHQNVTGAEKIEHRLELGAAPLSWCRCASPIGSPRSLPPRCQRIVGPVFVSEFCECHEIFPVLMLLISQ